MDPNLRACIQREVVTNIHVSIFSVQTLFLNYRCLEIFKKKIVWHIISHRTTPPTTKNVLLPVLKYFLFSCSQHFFHLFFFYVLWWNVYTVGTRENGYCKQVAMCVSGPGQPCSRDAGSRIFSAVGEEEKTYRHLDGGLLCAVVWPMSGFAPWMEEDGSGTCFK